MPGMFWYGGSSGVVVAPQEQPLALQSSITCFAGDLIVRTLNGGNMVQRPLTQADITALYLQGGNTCGVYGISPAPWVTDANGIATSEPAPAGVLGNVPVRFNLPARAAGNAPDSVTGRSMETVEMWKTNMGVGGNLWENTTITQNLVGTAVGILISTINGVITYFWSSAAATKVGVVYNVNTVDPLFNTVVTVNTLNTTHNPRCPIEVKPLAAFCQSDNAFNYTT